MTNKINEMEISSRNEKLIDYYEARLEIDPDTALGKTQKRFKLGDTQVRKITTKYSKYPKPSDYKKMVRDGEALGKLVADDSVDTDYNEGHGGLIVSKDIELAVKSAEKENIDVNSMFAEFLQILKHENITELTKENYIKLKQGVPLRKTLKQQVEDKKLEAEIMRYEIQMEKSKTAKIGEKGTYYITETGVHKLMGVNQSDNAYYNNDNVKNVVYNDEFKEMYNEVMNIKLESLIPNHNPARIAFKKNQFKLKWGFRIPRTEELRRLRAEREAQFRAERERKIIEVDFGDEHDFEQELEEYLDSLSTEKLAKILNGEASI